MKGQMIGPPMSKADTRRQPPASASRRAGADIVHAAVLLPASLGEFAATLAGGRPGRARRVLHAAMGILLPAGPPVPQPRLNPAQRTGHQPRREPPRRTPVPGAQAAPARIADRA